MLINGGICLTSDLLAIIKGSSITAQVINDARKLLQPPFYLYDASIIASQAANALAMPNAFGLTVRYAMKANSNAAILQLVSGLGLHIDASSLNEALRANYTGVGLDRIMLTTQEVPSGEARQTLEAAMIGGMKYNICSVRQLHLIGDFASRLGIPLSIRIHPEEGSGESASRNTGGKYSCFGVHLKDVPEVLDYASRKGLVFEKVHVHIGSGGDPLKWRANIDAELEIVERHFKDATAVSFGGGLKVARMPDETAADITSLGEYAKERIQAFYERNGRRLHMEVEPGTYIVANSGYVVTEVIDKKSTGADGFNFIITTGGMEVITRPLLYGSRHPFYVVSGSGELLSAEHQLAEAKNPKEIVQVGWCCESGDSLSLHDGHIVPRLMAEPDIGDLFVVGGAGAYCSDMSPANYNSHVEAPGLLFHQGKLQMIRHPQTLAQIIQNELGLDGRSITPTRK